MTRRNLRSRGRRENGGVVSLGSWFRLLLGTERLDDGIPDGSTGNLCMRTFTRRASNDWGLTQVG